MWTGAGRFRQLYDPLQVGHRRFTGHMAGDMRARAREAIRVGRVRVDDALPRRQRVRVEQAADGFAPDATGRQLGRDAVAPELVQFVDGHERVVLQLRGHAEALEHADQESAMVQPDDEVGKAQCAQHVADRREHLRFDHRRPGSDRVDVALDELAESSPRRTIRAPHRLNLIPLEEPWQFAAVLGNHPRQRYRQVVTQGQIGFARRFMLAAPEDLENQLGAFVAVLAGQRLDVFECRGLQRFEPVAPVHVFDHADHVVALAYLVGEKVTHAARGTRLLWHIVRALGSIGHTGGRKGRSGIRTL